MKGKEDPQRSNERFGRASAERQQGWLFWIHAASVGETMAVLPLIHRLAIAYPECNLLLTTGTVSSAHIAKERLPARAVHQYFPYDCSSYISRFLKNWRPDFVIWTESELWPNMMLFLKRRGIPTILVNARMSARSFDNWYHHRRFFDQVISAFSIILPASRQDHDYFHQLGVRNFGPVGNIKFASGPLPCDKDELALWQNSTQDRILFLATSTHTGEEEKIARVHEELKKRWSNFLTIIVPRHPARGKAICESLRLRNLVTGLRSENPMVQENEEIYIADTIGELGLFYRLATICFIGGSLAPIGGHNPIEAAHLRTAPIFGPHMENFKEIAETFVERKAAYQIHTQQELKEKIIYLFEHPDLCQNMIVSGYKLANEHRGLLDQIMGVIESRIAHAKQTKSSASLDFE